MWEVMHNSGYAAWASLFIGIAGLATMFTYGRKIGRPGSVATGFAVAVLASAAMGFGTGQVKVQRAVSQVTDGGDIATAVALVNEGTMEASQNLLFGGFIALLLLCIGGVMAILASRTVPDTARQPAVGAA